jgi:O-antigen/teichoic acid export membrane protein
MVEVPRVPSAPSVRDPDEETRAAAGGPSLGETSEPRPPGANAAGGARERRAPGATEARDGASDHAVPRRVWGGTALSIAGRLWGSACTMALLALASRHLAGPEFGRFTFYLALFALLDALVDFGTGTTAVQRSSADPDALPGILRAAGRIRLALSGVGVAAAAAFAFALREPGAWWIVLAALYPATHVLELSAVVFRNRIRLGVPVAVRAFAATARLGVVVALVSFDVGRAAPYLAATAAASAAANVVLYLAARPHLPRPATRPAPARGLLALAWPLGIAGLCQQAYFHVDNLFVRALVGLDELGVYNAGVRLLSVMILAAQFAPTVGLPWLVRRAGAGELGAATARLGQPLFVLGGLGAGAVYAWRADLLALLFGEQFRAGAPALGWLLLAVAAIHAGAPLLTAVVAAGRTRAVLCIAAGGLGVNLVGNALLVPVRAAEGAAIATLATELVVALGAAWVLVRAGHRPGGLGWAGGPAAFAAAAWISASLR